jgi:hypothetical protein
MLMVLSLLAHHTSHLLSKVKAALKESYKMTALGELFFCLGTQVAQYEDSVPLTQRTDVIKMLERFGMQDCKSCKASAAVHFKKDRLSAGESLSKEVSQRYQSIVRSLEFSRGKTTKNLSLYGYCDVSWGCQ